MLNRFAYILLLIIIRIPAFSQEYTIDIQPIRVNDGLLHRAVHTVIDDHKGFLWIGTAKGLQRYDGVEFKSWTHLGPNRKLQNVTVLLLDRENWLWIWDNSRLEFVFLHTESLEMLTTEQRFGPDFPLRRNAANIGWSGGDHFSHSDSKGKLFFTMPKPNRLLIYDKGKEFATVPLPELQSEQFNLMGIDENGNLWIDEYSAPRKVSLFAPDGKLLASFPCQPETSQLVVEPYLPGKMKISYLEADHYIQKIIDINMPNEPPVVKQSMSKFGFTFRASNGLNWMNATEGWNIVDASHQLLGRIPREGNDKGLFEMLQGMYEDQRNRMWIFGQWGLFRVIAKPTKFNRLLQAKAGQQINRSTRGIVTAGDSVFVNMEFSGLAAIPKSAPEDWAILNTNEDRESHDGRPLIKLQNGDLLLGFPGKLQVLKRNGVLKKTFPIPGRFSACWALFEDRKDRIWIGSGTGVSVKYPNQDQLEYLENVPLGENGRLPEIYHFSEPAEDEIWICGRAGLGIYDAASRQLLGTYRESMAPPFFLPLTVCYFHHLDRDGIHWIGCDDGLIRWDKAANTYRKFTVADGLPNDVIYAIFEDEAGMLWLSSDYGIIRFDRTTYQTEAFLPQHGIAQHEFNRISAYQDAEGTIYFGGLNGITAFHPRDFASTREEQAYQVQLTDLQFLGGASDSLRDRTAEIAANRTIVFEPGDRFFRIRFALPILDDPANTLYAWRIEGLDENWNYQKENVIQISTLPYGEYTLEIKGQDNSRSWTAPLRIQIIASAPFYLHTWFIIFCALLLLLIAWIFYKLRTRQFQRQQKILEDEVRKATFQIEKDRQTIAHQAEELKELDRVKSRFFANVSHEFRTPLSLILGPIGSIMKSGELKGRNLQLLESAQKNGKNLLKLVGSILDLSKMESGKMELQEEKVHLLPFLRTTVFTFESYAQQAGIELRFDHSIDPGCHVLIDRKKLETVLNNLLSNALKYTPQGGQIQVMVEDPEDKLFLQVVDTGRGIHPDDLPRIFDRFYQSRQKSALTEGGTGIGLALSRELVKIMGGEIGAESTLRQGSRFWLKLPRKEVAGVQQEKDVLVPESTEIPEPLTVPEQAVDPEQKTIMIVEDNQGLREYLGMLLGPRYNLLTCENGRIALDALTGLSRASLPDLILSDIMMPEMDGYQLLEQLKSQDRYRTIPVVMLTARAAIEDKLAALRIGVDDYLLKPFEEDELLARIENLLRHAEGRTQPASSVPADPDRVVPASSQEDQIWLQKLETHILAHLESDLLSVAMLADEFAMSQSTLQRQLKKLVGLSPIKYIQEHRLNKARELLENRRYNTVAQVAYKVGFKDPKSFTRSFRQRFGKTPSEFFQT